jgi:putative nucleotidyltransferase with HDIG domain
MAGCRRGIELGLLDLELVHPELVDMELADPEPRGLDLLDLQLVRVELAHLERPGATRRGADHVPMTERMDRSASRTTLVITIAAVGAAFAVAGGAQSGAHAITSHPLVAATFLVLALVLQLFSVQVYGKGSIGVSAIAILATGFSLGPGVAILVAVVTAASHSARRRALPHRWVFDGANLVLAAGTSALVYTVFAGGSSMIRLLGATLAGIVFTGINNGLLCLAMTVSESGSFTLVWRERFHWARFHFLAFGPLALALTIAHQQLGLTGVFAFALPPALLLVSAREYLSRTRGAFEEVNEANRQLRRAHLDTIAALSRSMEAKDFATGGHTERVAELAMALARRLGYAGEDLKAIEIGALLHDVGKIGVPENILHKPGPLDPSERAVMERHPVISEFILAETALHPFVHEIARSSHERIDGTGYPDRLAGDDIPLPARIVMVADAFDALTSDRPYRLAQSTEVALTELRANTGTQFCPRVMAAFERLRKDEPQLLSWDVPSGRRVSERLREAS